MHAAVLQQHFVIGETESVGGAAADKRGAIVEGIV